MKTETKILKLRIKSLLLVIICSLLVTTLGCDSFVRKFTRKSKKDKDNAQELVLAPQEYRPPKISKEDAYRKYFLYWKSWHDELINALSGGISNKKQLACIIQAIDNLEELKKTLQQVRQNKIDTYINQLKDLKGDITQDLYGNNIMANRMTAERIKRNILRDFSYEKIKDNLA
jgi:hypothetical protein